MEQISSYRTKNKTTFLFGVTIAISFLLGIWFRNLIPVAIVDGQFVTRSEFTSLLLERSGRDVMQRIIIKKFVNDEAHRRKVTVVKKEIQEQIDIVLNKLKKEHATFQQYLNMQNLTEKQFVEELELQLKVKKMFGPAIVITNKEIDTYLREHKIVKGIGAIYQSQKVDIYDALFKQKLQNEFRLFIARRLKDARIHYFIKI